MAIIKHGEGKILPDDESVEKTAASAPSPDDNQDLARENEQVDSGE